MLFTWLRRYADFNGRSSRKEYWLGVLGYCLLAIGVAVIDAVVFGDRPVIFWLLWLGAIVPMTALLVRRLHDLDLTGWLTLVSFVPLINLILLFWAVQPGQPRDNRFGAPPPETPGLAPAAEAPPAA